MNAATGPKGNLLHVVDEVEGHKWLVDGGALLSIIPPTPAQRRAGPIGPGLCAANGTKIECFGSVNKTLIIGKRSFTFAFTIANVRQRILGADFLSEFYLAPNHRDGTLIDLSRARDIYNEMNPSSPIDLNTLDVLPATFAHGAKSTPVTLINEVNDPFYKLLDSFPEILTPSFTPVEVKHGVRHHIPTTGHPVQSRARKLDAEKLRVAKQEIDKLVKLGVCQRASASESEWASPLMVAKKPCLSQCKCTPTVPCGGWRVCGDYRRLNAITQDDKYPVRSINDFNAELHGKTIFSKIDLMKGYHQIPVAPDDVRKTGIITPFGLFIFPRTPFGLKNAGQDFQRLMDSILGDIPRVYVYIDDILVASESPEQHMEDLKTVFKILADNGLVVQRSKCVLGKSSLEFLGYHVDANGVSPLPTRVEAIKEVPAPTTIKELQRFLGMVNYYRRFIRRAAHHLHPLFEALKGPKKKKGQKKPPLPKTLTWNEDRQRSFEAIKEALASATLLHHPRPNAPMALTTDASKFALGAVLEQLGPDGWEPLAFYSAKLEGKQIDWPAYDRELLGLFRATRHFRPMVEGHAFTIWTDQQALVPSMKKKSDPLTPRQTYQLSCLSEYTTDIRYIEGKSNIVADALSRPPGCEKTPISLIAAIEALATQPTDIPNLEDNETTSALTTDAPPPSKDTAIPANRVEDLCAVINAINGFNVNLHEMARDQVLDPDFARLSTEARTGLNFKKVNLGEAEILVDVSNGPARPFVPYSWRRRIFDAIHGLGHPGVERTRQTICSKFVWPSIRQDVSKWARECQECQRAKVTRHVVPPIGNFAVPPKRFQHWNIDIVTLPISNGYKYLLTAVDRLTRWPLAIPMKDITASTVIDAFTHGLIASFGIPEAITTDNGGQFSSAIWQQLLNVWGIKAHFTTPYHPQSNGLVERFHRRLKESLNALALDEPENWFWALPCTLLAIRTTLKPDIGASPADLVFGEGLAIPGELLPGEFPNESAEQDQRRQLLDNLRLEVARVQPKPTSAHRIPRVNLPEALQTASHAFVRRGGYQASLATPYVGPYRIIDRHQDSFRIAIPGAQSENVNVTRLRPAVMPEENNSEEAPTSPPHPPRPNRRSRPPANPQPPSDRRQSTSRLNPAQSDPANQSPPSYDPGEGTSAQARARTDSISSDEEDNYLRRLRRSHPANNDSEDESETADPFDGHSPADTNLTPCQCNPPDDPAAPCNAGPSHRLLTPARQQTTPPPSSLSNPGNNSIPLPPAISPHPRSVRGADIIRRQARARHNYGPSLSAILKSHVGL